MSEVYVWLWPLIGVIIIISIIAVFSTMKVAKFQERQSTAADTEIAAPIKRHPFAFNPIILAYIIAGIFVIAMIVYYAATTHIR